MGQLAPYLLAIAACIGVSALLPVPARTASVSDAARSTGVRALGATRGYATTALWLRAGEAYRRGDLYETTATYQLIRELQPRNPAVYSFLGWIEAYNISAQFTDRARSEEWVLRGLATIHDGQDRMPEATTLNMDEWHFVLNRTIGHPIAILRAQRERYAARDRSWALIVEATLKAEADIPATERKVLDEFFREVGFHLDAFDAADRAFELPSSQLQRLLDPRFEDLPPQQQGDLAQAFDEVDRRVVRVLFALEPDTLQVLATAHWCRLHLLMLCLRDTQRWPRSLSLDVALLNSYRLAYERLPREFEQEFAAPYRQGVAKAFRNGIENARQYGGKDAVAEFIEDQRFNFDSLPDLMPPETLDKALQENQG